MIVILVYLFTQVVCSKGVSYPTSVTYVVHLESCGPLLESGPGWECIHRNNINVLGDGYNETQGTFPSGAVHVVVRRAAAPQAFCLGAIGWKAPS